MSASAELPALVSTYFLAWQEHDREKLEAIFTEDADYVILGKKTLTGLAEILDYWRVNETQQRSIRWSVSECHPIDEGWLLIWTATFERLDRGLIYCLEGMMWLKCHNTRISRLVECYHKTTQAIL